MLYYGCMLDVSRARMGAALPRQQQAYHELLHAIDQVDICRGV